MLNSRPASAGSDPLEWVRVSTLLLRFSGRLLAAGLRKGRVFLSSFVQCLAFFARSLTSLWSGTLVARVPSRKSFRVGRTFWMALSSSLVIHHSLKTSREHQPSAGKRPSRSRHLVGG